MHAFLTNPRCLPNNHLSSSPVQPLPTSATYFTLSNASVDPETELTCAVAFAFWYSCEMGLSPVVSSAFSSVLRLTSG